MSAELVLCRCRTRAPANPDHHGTAPDGRQVERSAIPPCDLCGGSGRATHTRLRASAAARALALFGLCAAGLALLGWIAPLALPVRGLAAAALASLAAAGLFELYLARTARRER